MGIVFSFYDHENLIMDLLSVTPKTPHKGTSWGVRPRFWWNWNMLKRIKKKWDTCFFLSAGKRFKRVKTTPKVCTQKWFFFSISRKIIIFFSKSNVKIFFIKRQSRVQNFCFEGLHPLFYSNIIVHYATSAMKRFLTSVSLQHEPKASDVITLVKKTFVRMSIVRNFISRGVKMRIFAREACVKPH